MQILRGLEKLQNFSTGSVVTIGNFDGVHAGHRLIISEVKARASTLGLTSAAVTFDPHPAHLLHTASRLQLITPLTHKLELLASTGLDAVIVLPFQEIREWTAKRFAQDILHAGLGAVEVHEGETFRFGHHAEAGVEQLTELGIELGFTVHACSPVVLCGQPVSSSRIRRLIADGKVSEARALLRSPFSVLSTPAPGRGYGTRYAVPTINLAPYSELLPAHGVYITCLRVGSGGAAKHFRGVTNVGNRPTFGADSFAVESHLLDFEPVELSEDTPLELSFLKRLRPEQRFPSPEALRAQIGLDVRRATRYFELTDRFAPKSGER
jgi:riboflavin kinase/FMN adenylyltransferase